MVKYIKYSEEEKAIVYGEFCFVNKKIISFKLYKIEDNIKKLNYIYDVKYNEEKPNKRVIAYFSSIDTNDEDSDGDTEEFIPISNFLYQYNEAEKLEEEDNNIIIVIPSSLNSAEHFLDLLE